MRFSCNHEFEFSDKVKKTHYFLWYDSHSTHYYVFNCSKCGKEKKFKISWNEYYRKDNWLVDKLKK